ncbi:hypothetical protein VNI00_019028 [Paramarasmius palmivorus]|uniref:Uncharacterized protein n=1 Tax=Paramarasmius palmivorus TaxID=297713 RepID=A0AAW0ASU8_9AGAR
MATKPLPPPEPPPEPPPPTTHAGQSLHTPPSNVIAGSQTSNVRTGASSVVDIGALKDPNLLIIILLLVLAVILLVLIVILLLLIVVLLAWILVLLQGHSSR